MAVRRSSVALAVILGTLLAVVLSVSVENTLDANVVTGVPFDEVAVVALLYAAAALQFRASLFAAPEKQAAAALWIPGGIAAGALVGMVVGPTVFETYGGFIDLDLFAGSVIQLAAAFGTAALVGFSRRGRRGAPPRDARPLPALFVFTGWALAVVLAVSLGWVSWVETGERYLETHIAAQLLLPPVMVLAVYALAGVVGLRGPWLRLGSAAVISGMAVTGFAAVAVRPREVPWRLEVLGPEARLLVLRAQDGRACSARLRAEVVKRTASEVHVRVTRSYGRCGRPDRGIEGNPQTVQVALDPPLHGERITGTRMLPITRSLQVKRIAASGRRAGRAAREIRRVMPRMTGMAPEDARAFIGTGRLRVGVVRWAGDGPSGRAVIAQTPAASGLIGPPLSNRWRRPSQIPITLTTGD